MAVSAAIASTIAGTASAQQLEEVIVTATKRSESVMDVPLAITAVSGQFIQEANLDNVKDLIAYTPGVTGNTKDSFIDYVSVRGILTNDFGIGGDPSVGMYKNNLYQGRNGAVVTSLYDIERAEILRGPQGFLFGRGAISGAMNITTVRPDTEKLGGYAEVDVGERDHFVGEGAINLPVTDHLAFRIAGIHSEEGDYIDNRYEGLGNDEYGGHDTNAGRFSALYEQDRLQVNFMFEYEDRNQSGSIYVPTAKDDIYEYLTELYGPLGYPAPHDVVNADMSLGNRDNSEVYSYGLQIDYDFGFATLTSITGYRDHTFGYSEDFDAVPLVINSYAQDQDGDYFEQELRLVSDSDGPLDWYVGASYYEEHINATFKQEMSEDFWCSAYWSYYDTTCQDLFDYYKGYAAYYPDGEYVQYFLDYFGTVDWEGSPTGNMIDANRAKGKYRGYAVYFDLGYEFNEHWDASLGVRYTWDKKKFSNYVLPSNSPVLGNRAALGFSTPEGPLKDSKSWDRVTPRVILNYRPDPDNLLFASITTGYKSGGFNSFGVTPPAEYGFTEAVPGEYKPSSYKPETSTSYELGYKGTLFDGNTQLSVNAFYYEYKDLQATYYEGALFFADNVGKVDGWGSEVSVVQRLGEHFSVNTGIAWFDSEANDVQKICSDFSDDCEGRSLPWAPDWSGHVALNGRYNLGEGELFGVALYHFQTKTEGGFEAGASKNDGYGQLDISVGYEIGHYTVTAYVDNATDEDYYDGVADGDGTIPAHWFGISRPRTYGLKVSMNFD